jgi:hypothetical protein
MGRHCANCDAISSITCSIQRKAAAAGKAQIDGHILNSIFMQILQLPFTFPKSLCELFGNVLASECYVTYLPFVSNPPHPLKKKRIVKIKPIS